MRWSPQVTGSAICGWRVFMTQPQLADATATHRVGVNKWEHALLDGGSAMLRLSLAPWGRCQ